MMDPKLSFWVRVRLGQETSDNEVANMLKERDMDELGMSDRESPRSRAEVYLRAFAKICGFARHS